MAPPEVGERSKATIQQCLDAASRALSEAGRPTPRLDAEVLLAHTLQVGRTYLYTYNDRTVPDHVRSTFQSLLERRVLGEPVAYLTGRREFLSLDFEVSRDTLIPRAETEGLAEAAIQWLQSNQPQAARIADVGTGTGILACVVALRHPTAKIWATDILPGALEVARRNATRHGVSDRIEFIEGSLLEPVPRPLDLVISNPPYIGEDEFVDLPIGVRDYEPRPALISGPTGLEVLSSLADQAAQALRPGGSLMVEIAPGQAAAMRDILARAGFEAVEVSHDLSGFPRLARGSRP